MVDFHSHALPGIDDGATDADMSAAMLELSKSQGVDTVVLTPHFYYNGKNIDEFLEKREASYNILTEYIKANNIDAPKLVKGAEVRFSYDLLDSPDITKLCIENTNVILIEMPFSHWNAWLFDKLFETSASKNIDFVIAHAERYVKNKKDIKKVRPLFDMGYAIQINSDSFVKFGKRKIVKQFVLEGKVNLIGSDAHNNTLRKTSMDKAYKYIRRVFGKELTDSISQWENTILKRVDI